MVHEARRGGMPALGAGPGAPRHAPGHGPLRRDVLPRRSRVPALHRARPRAQAVDGVGVSLGHRGSLAPGVRVEARRVGDHLGHRRWIATADRSLRTRNQLIVLLHWIFVRARKVYGLRPNPVAEVEKFPQRQSCDIEVYSPEEVWALVRPAASEQDAAIYLTAASPPTLWRVDCVAVAGRRSCRLSDPGALELRGRRIDNAEKREGALSPDGPGSRVGSGQAGRSRALDG